LSINAAAITPPIGLAGGNRAFLSARLNLTRVVLSGTKRRDGHPIWIIPSKEEEAHDLYGDLVFAAAQSAVVIGCGAGHHVLRLAALFPQAQFLGVDLDEPSIMLAEIARLFGGRLRDEGWLGSDLARREAAMSASQWVSTQNWPIKVPSPAIIPGRLLELNRDALSPFPNARFLAANALTLADKSLLEHDAVLIPWVIGFANGIVGFNRIVQALVQAVRITKPGGRVRVYPGAILEFQLLLNETLIQDLINNLFARLRIPKRVENLTLYADSAKSMHEYRVST
jgi:ubiquinone/menaquinone biosynthesis C-methylase UbiE